MELEMKIGVYLPALLHGTGPREARDWARAADQLGLDSLAISSDGADAPYQLLIAAAAVTERIALIGDVSYGSAWTAAAQVAHTIQLEQASGGRFTASLTFAQDDIAVKEAQGVDGTGASHFIDMQLAEVQRIWQSRAPGTSRLERYPLVIGGPLALTAGSVIRHADGWLMRAGTPGQFSDSAATIRSAWAAAARPGTPSLTAVFHYALGDDALHAAEALHWSYARRHGDEFVADVIAGSATDEEQLRDLISAFAAAGADQLLAVPAVPEFSQLEGLAAACRPIVHV
jgi:alkanesulfonate monooxygenase SsuD/methylene tetrahydromethanopterin reductase-like flavin-dependent oxidoreductase (luciferase family)